MMQLNYIYFILHILFFIWFGYFKPGVPKLVSGASPKLQISPLSITPDSTHQLISSNTKIWNVCVRQMRHAKLYFILVYNYLFTTLIFFHLKFARQTSQIIVNIVYCVFAISYIAYLYIVLLLSVSCPVAVILLHCGASVTNSLYV